MSLLTAEQLMGQAHATADTYADKAFATFRSWGLEPEDNPQAFATFASGFMIASAIDFATATMSGLNRDAPLADLISLARDHLHG